MSPMMDYMTYTKAKVIYWIDGKKRTTFFKKSLEVDPK